MKHPHTTRRLRLETLEARRVLSTISGVLWNDVDGDRTRHVLEPGLPGRTVYLDANDNGRLDDGESTTTTDATGGYEFAGLPAGNYTMQQVLPAGWQQTSPVETRAEFVDVLAPITDGGPLQLSLDFTFGSDGTVYINSWGTDSIERYDPASGQYLGSFVASGDGGLDSPRGIAFGPDGNLYVASNQTDQILRYDGDTGDFLDVFVTADRGGLRRPLGIQFGPAGQLFVSHYFSDEILRYDGATGRFIDAFVLPGSGGLNRPRASTFGLDGALYVSSQSVSFVREGVTFHDVLRYDGETGEFIDVFAATPNGRAEGLEFGPDGYLYVGQRGTGSVLRFDGESGAPIDEFIPGGLDGIAAGRFVHFGPDGLLYVSYQNSGLHRFELIKNGRDVSLGNQQTRAGIDFGSQHTGTGPVEDLTGNGFVDFEDLTVLLANWNRNVGAAQGNLVNPGSSPVNFEDLTVLLAAWTGPGGAASPQAAVGTITDSRPRLAAAHETIQNEHVESSRRVAAHESSAPRQAAAYDRRGSRGRLPVLSTSAVDAVLRDSITPGRDTLGRRRGRRV